MIVVVKVVTPPRRHRRRRVLREARELASRSSPNGLKGIQAGAAIIFFAFIGFDAISTTAEETRNPGRDLPRGILGILAICTVIYVGVCAVVAGILPYAAYRGVADPHRARVLVHRT